MKSMRGIIVLALLSISFNSNAQNVKILFDASKAESAGNADWVIDASNYNLGFLNGPAVLGQGTESNAQQYPSPSQTGITGSTPESYWQGGLSYWGIDCVKIGYTVATLPYNGRITYGDVTNVQDLSNYTVFIVCEPNIQFTSNEKMSILTFVQNGGGLFMISDHDVSDRNGDGWDSPHIWNDLMDTNSIRINPFGFTFDYVDISQTTSNIPTLPGDSILHGPFGNVTQVKWSNGTTMTLDPSANSSVKGVIYETGSAFGNNNVMCAYSRFGNGKVAVIGDSSPCDDGSGDLNDQLYDGYISDAAGNHQKLLMNMTIWLAETPLNTDIAEISQDNFNLKIYPNPVTASELNLKYSLISKSLVSIQVFDISGNLKKEFEKGIQEKGDKLLNFDVSTLENGFYLCRIITGKSAICKSFVIQKWCK